MNKIKISVVNDRLTKNNLMYTTANQKFDYTVLNKLLNINLRILNLTQNIIDNE